MLYDAAGRALERAPRLGFVWTGPAFRAVPEAAKNAVELADAIASERVEEDEETDIE